MKGLFTYVLATLVLIAITISCKKDDPAPAAPTVLGSWKFTSYAATACTSAADEESETCSSSLLDCGGLILTATEYTYNPGLLGGGTAESGIYTISGTNLTISPTGGTASVFTFVVTSTTLTLVQVDSSTGCTQTTTFTRQ